MYNAIYMLCIPYTFIRPGRTMPTRCFLKSTKKYILVLKKCIHIYRFLPRSLPFIHQRTNPHVCLCASLCLSHSLSHSLFLSLSQRAWPCSVPGAR